LLSNEQINQLLSETCLGQIEIQNLVAPLDPGVRGSLPRTSSPSSDLSGILYALNRRTSPDALLIVLNEAKYILDQAQNNNCDTLDKLLNANQPPNDPNDSILTQEDLHKLHTTIINTLGAEDTDFLFIHFGAGFSQLFPSSSVPSNHLLLVLHFLNRTQKLADGSTPLLTLLKNLQPRTEYLPENETFNQIGEQIRKRIDQQTTQAPTEDIKQEAEHFAASVNPPKTTTNEVDIFPTPNLPENKTHSKTYIFWFVLALLFVIGLTAIAVWHFTPPNSHIVIQPNHSERFPDRQPTIDQPPTCQQGFTRCGVRCVNLKSDKKNCGTCGRACASGQSCCDGDCYNLTTNIAHCGGCEKKCDLDQVCERGNCIPRQCLEQPLKDTSIFRAISYCETELVKCFLSRHNIDVNKVIDEEEHTMLAAAVDKCCIPVTRLLLDKKANPNTMNKYKLSPLNIVERKCNPRNNPATDDAIYTKLRSMLLDKRTRRVLECKANPSKEEVFRAVSQCETEIVKCYLKRGLDVNKTIDGHTMLAIAADKCCIPVTRHLLAKGANPNIKSKYGLSPLNIVEKMCKPGKKAGQNPSTNESIYKTLRKLLSKSTPSFLPPVKVVAPEEIVSLERANRLFRLLSIHECFPIEKLHVDDGSPIRAHAMWGLANQQGIYSQKIWALPKRGKPGCPKKRIWITHKGKKYEWCNHVALLLNTDKGKRVLDPTSSNKLVTVEEWKKIIHFPSETYRTSIMPGYHYCSSILQGGHPKFCPERDNKFKLTKQNLKYQRISAGIETPALSKKCK